MVFETINDMCAERGISIAKLEAECGLGNATIRRWNKSMPRLDTLQKVADYLKVSVDDLLNRRAKEKGE